MSPTAEGPTVQVELLDTDRKTAQLIATRLHKAFHADRYLYWSVIAAMLQAHDPTTPESMQPILYKLAQRLLASSDAPPYASADRFHLHLSVLKALGELDDAAKLLDTEEGKMIVKTSLVVDELRREIVKERGELEAEGIAAQAKLTTQK